MIATRPPGRLFAAALAVASSGILAAPAAAAPRPATGGAEVPCPDDPDVPCFRLVRYSGTGCTRSGAAPEVVRLAPQADGWLKVLFDAFTSQVEGPDQSRVMQCVVTLELANAGKRQVRITNAFTQGDYFLSPGAEAAMKADLSWPAERPVAAGSARLGRNHPADATDALRKTFTQPFEGTTAASPCQVAPQLQLVVEASARTSAAGGIARMAITRGVAGTALDFVMSSC